MQLRNGLNGNGQDLDACASAKRTQGNRQSMCIRVKENQASEVDRYKARLVAKDSHISMHRL